MNKRGKKSTEKTKQNAASVKSAAVSGGKKKPEPAKQPEQAGPLKPVDRKKKADDQVQGATDCPGSGKGSNAGA
ncbi:MAG: hypothetical protein WA666_07350 [Nitrospirota bacterium]